MKITLNWLRELVDVPLPVDELCETLTMAGIEVESVEKKNPVWDAVEVAALIEVSPHPNADRLKLCTLRTRAGTAHVVCGASNMKAGDKVALAPPGAELPGARRIERATIRGQASDGMLCSARELDLPEDDTGGIMILPADAPVGSRLVDLMAAEDTVLELALTPNRGDCLSVLGIAREVAALTGASLHPRTVSLIEQEAGAARFAKVAVDAPDLCPRYCARVLRDVRIAPSPPWMCMRLEMVGLRPINNVVDATNYVMLESGQPLHAFDLTRVVGRRVTARRAGNRELITTLDGITRELEPDDLVIADDQRPIALAGIMGGAESEIRWETTAVLLESAFFIPETIRRTSRRLAVSSDSSYRFERGVDPSGTIAALDRAAELIVAGAGGTVAKGVLERRASIRKPRPPIRLRPARVNTLLGTRLTASDMARPLRALGAVVSERGKAILRVTPPPHRFDLQGEVDLVEEIVRLSGYDAVAVTMPTVPLGGPGPEPGSDVDNRLREALRAAGLNEMVTLALVSSEENRAFPGLPETAGEPVALLNPLSADAAELRRSLLPGLLHALEENLRYEERLVAGFSIGRVYVREDQRYRERRAIGILIAGQWSPAQIGEPVRACHFGDLRGAVDLALARLHVNGARWERVGDEAPHLHPGKAARIVIGGAQCGVAGALHPELIAARRLEVEPWVAELDMAKVVQYCPRRISFRPLPRFPAVERDLAVVVDIGFQAQEILDAIREIAQPLVEEVRVFDHYVGAPIPPGRKSLAYSIAYRASDRTLTDDEVNIIHNELMARLVQRLPLEIRR